MSYSGSPNSRGGASSGNAWRSEGGIPPHAFDPDLEPELFRGVLTRRVFACLIDLVVHPVEAEIVIDLVFFAAGFRFGTTNHKGQALQKQNVFGPPTVSDCA